MNLKKKLTLFLSILFVLHTFAQNSDKNINISFSDISLSEAIKKIESISKYTFFYDAQKIDLKQKVSLKANSLTIIQTVNQLLLNTNIKFEINNLQIALYQKASKQLNENFKKISGLVTDQKGDPIVGASVIIKGQLTGTVTYIQGKYTLEVPANATLKFSYIGYLNTEISVANKNTVNAVLKENSELLDEVVVVGYGTQRKSDVTGSLSSIRQRDYENQPITNTEDILKGRAAGVSVTQSSGQLGGDFKIRVRGANSLYGSNDPLLVLDGIQTNLALSDLNSDDIESMEVLKDASSTAIYGSRGANGVILITTKNGTEGPTTVEFKSSASFSRGSDPYKIMDPVTYANTTNLYIQGKFSDTDIQGFKLLGKGTNMYDALLQNGLSLNNSVSISGGSKNTKFMFSGSDEDCTGVLIGTTFKKLTLRSNISTKIGNRLTIGFNVVGNQNTGHNNWGAYDELMYANTWSPVSPILNSDGTYNIKDYNSFAANPYMTLKEMNQDVVRTNAQLSTNINYKIINGLTFNSNIGVNALYTTAANVNNQFRAYAGGVAVTGAYQNYSNTQYWQMSNTLTYEKSINEIHNISIMAGYEESEYINNNFQALGTILPNAASVGWYNLGQNATSQISSGYTGSGLRSFIGRANYSLYNRYLLTATLRYDGSSKFRGDNVYSTFPSVGFGWRLNEEDFIKNLNIFSNLKLRASIGQTGNQAIGSYGTMALLNTTNTNSNYSYGSAAYSPGVTITQLPNSNIKWETSTQKDVGLDASFFKGRLSFILDYYSKLTTGLLQQVPIPDFAGGGTVVENVGSIQNNGYEISINAVPIQNNAWKWDATFNFSYSSNKVVSLGQTPMIFPVANYMSTESLFAIMPGQPLAEFYGYKWLGIWKTSQATEAAKYGCVPGNNRYQDVNGDGKIDQNDLRPLGCAVPNIRLGFNTTLSYKNFTLNAFFEGALGNEVYNVTLSQASIPSSNSKTPLLVDGLNYWSSQNENGTYVPASVGSPNYLTNSSRWLFDGSYVKLKNISLSYHLSKKVIRIADVKIYVSAQNMLILTNYKGSDPESTNSGSDDKIGGIDYGTYPMVKSITTGATITF